MTYEDLERARKAMYGDGGNKEVKPEPESNQTTVQVTPKRVIKICWSMLWMEGIYVLVASVWVALIAVAAPFIGYQAKTVEFIGNAMVLIVGFPVNYLIFKIVLEKKYSDFKVALIKP